MEAVILDIISLLPPTELFNVLIFIGMGYTFKIVFSRLTKMMDDRAKVSEARNKALLEINKRFDSYTEEHRHEHNQMENRLNHMQTAIAEIRKDAAFVRDSQIRMEAKLDVLLENFARRRNEKN